MAFGLGPIVPGVEALQLPVEGELDFDRFGRCGGGGEGKDEATRQSEGLQNASHDHMSPLLQLLFEGCARVLRPFPLAMPLRMSARAICRRGIVPAAFDEYPWFPSRRDRSAARGKAVAANRPAGHAALDQRAHDIETDTERRQSKQACNDQRHFEAATATHPQI